MSKSADAFRTISEVADWLELPPHVLRFWESKFSQVKPVKRAGGRRYYRPNDMILLAGIKHLLHVDGMTIKAVQQKLRTDGIKSVAALSPPLDGATPTDAPIEATIVSPTDLMDSDVADAPVMIDADVDEFSPIEADTVVNFPSDTPFVSEPEVMNLVPQEPETIEQSRPEVEDIDAPDPEHPQKMVEEPSLGELVQEPVSEPISEPDLHAEPAPIEIPQDAAELPSFVRHGLSDTGEDDLPDAQDDAAEPELKEAAAPDPIAPEPIEPAPVEPPARKPATVTVAPDPQDFALPALKTTMGQLSKTDLHDLRRLAPRLAPLHARLVQLRSAMDARG